MEIHSIVLIGASTGGPGRIHDIIQSLPSNYGPAVIIAQHMAEPFIPSFVKQLNLSSMLPVHDARKPIKIENGHIYVCGITSHLKTDNFTITLEPLICDHYPYNPHIDPLLSSASLLSTSIRKMGVILTGIGDDGARGALDLYNAGSECYFENEESATVYGMPRRAKELVPDALTGTMPEIITAIQRFGAV